MSSHLKAPKPGTLATLGKADAPKKPFNRAANLGKFLHKPKAK